MLLTVEIDEDSVVVVASEEAVAIIFEVAVSLVLVLSELQFSPYEKSSARIDEVA